jgi:hypothetical protein
MKVKRPNARSTHEFTLLDSALALLKKRLAELTRD